MPTKAPKMAIGIVFIVPVILLRFMPLIRFCPFLAIEMLVLYHKTNEVLVSMGLKMPS